jgi:hypothetical protein
MRPTLFVLPMILAPSLASADELHAPATAQPSMYDLGVRVGGYGFRREGDNSAEGWTECQMGGLGVFASRRLPGPLFVEAGVDAYTSRGDGLPTDLPISRMSGLATVAAGARTDVTSWLRGFIQVGGGLELTRVSVPYGEDETIRDSQVLPTGFIGFGLDIRLAKRTYVGMNVRTHAMGNFNYKRDELEMKEAWGFTTPDEGAVFEPSLDFAAQGQFYIRRDL